VCCVTSVRHQAGPNIINFADGGCITYSLPEAHVGGILFGERIIEYLGTIDFRDEQNGLSYALFPWSPLEARTNVPVSLPVHTVAIW
jgi:hypothetical protein